ncbi:hypothetical protein Pint_12287 [Pistacia integerrima]|uniref:Uncharacterized protein n=1 Tax=Pistacia integerrima TaxID=434235 RepID=A0ACC0XJY1_9ROSI|nr:hypothetical protein Pint_12287 [Pistacia integerrima]
MKVVSQQLVSKNESSGEIIENDTSVPHEGQLVKLSKDGDTVLHIAAAGERHTGFVKKLLEQMNKEDLAIKNNAGNTAFFLAAASKRVEIVKAMMEKNEDKVKIRGDSDMLPLHKAALMGDKETVEYLYDATGDELLDDNDRFELLLNLVNNGLYGKF